MELGIKLKKTFTVEKDMTAKAVGSGGIDVLSTPSLIAKMEYTALNSIKDQLGEDEATVGTYVECKHMKATPLGAEFEVESELIEIDRRALTFMVRSYYNGEMIGEGSHKRFIINTKKFMDKTNKK